MSAKLLTPPALMTVLIKNVNATLVTVMITPTPKPRRRVMSPTEAAGLAPRQSTDERPTLVPDTQPANVAALPEPLSVIPHQLRSLILAKAATHVRGITTAAEAGSIAKDRPVRQILPDAALTV